MKQGILSLGMPCLVFLFQEDMYECIFCGILSFDDSSSILRP